MMHRCTDSGLFFVPLRPLLLAVVLLLGGCDKQESTAKPPEKEEPADKHAHDAHHDEVKLSADAIKKYGITVEPAKRVAIQPTLVAPARVSFNTEAMAHVGAILRGRIVEVKIRKGDAVKKGDELFVVESPELGETQSDYLQKKSAVEAASTVELAKSAFDRAKTLFETSQGISLTDLQKREADYKAALAAARSARSAFTAAENKLQLLGMDQKAIEELAKSQQIKPRHAVTAPIAGQVIEREATLGELVNPDKEALLVLADLSTFWVIADVPEARLAEIVVGARARVNVGVMNAETIEGKVSLIDAALDPTTRSARIRVEVAGGNNIRPGMFAQVEIFLKTEAADEPTLAIPDEAVQNVEGGPAVFVPVKGEDNTFVKRAVTVGKTVGGMTPVLSGLKEGQELVTKGSFILKAELGKNEASHED